MAKNQTTPDTPASSKRTKKPNKVTKKEIEQALIKSGGNYSVAAALLSKIKSEALGIPFSITRQSISERVHKDPDLNRAANEGQEMMLDIAESKLGELIKGDNLTAIIFYLKCKGKQRGYIEKSITELTGEDGGPVEVKSQINLSRATKEDLISLVGTLEKIID